MIRLLLYVNEYQIEGLIATATREKVSPHQIRERVEAYRKVRPNLVKHAQGYPTADYLLERIKAGVKGRSMALVGAGRSTKASEYIISIVDRSEARPVWITVWGAPTDLAQALWDVSDRRSKADVARFVSKLRVYDIAGQDSTGAWLCHTFPEIFWVRSVDQFQAISVREASPFPLEVTGADIETFTTEWVDEHVQSHGPLGRLYPERRWKYEGDTPALRIKLDDNTILFVPVPWPETVRVVYEDRYSRLLGRSKRSTGPSPDSASHRVLKSIQAAPSDPERVCCPPGVAVSCLLALLRPRLVPAESPSPQR